MVTQYQRTAKPYTDSAQHIRNRRVANPAVRRCRHTGAGAVADWDAAHRVRCLDTPPHMVARHCQMGKWLWHLVNQPMLQQGWDTTAVFNVGSDRHLRTSAFIRNRIVVPSHVVSHARHEDAFRRSRQRLRECIQGFHTMFAIRSPFCNHSITPGHTARVQQRVNHGRSRP